VLRTQCLRNNVDELQWVKFVVKEAISREVLQRDELIYHLNYRIESLGSSTKNLKLLLYVRLKAILTSRGMS
jgi:hypothetical protein